MVVMLFAPGAQSMNPYISDYFFAHIEKNKETAIQYLVKNASSNSDSAYILGMVYLEASKYDLATEFLEKAASKNHKQAINALGDFYYSDENDIETAVKHYERGAKMSYGPSQFNLGIIYLKHYKQHKKAKYWLNKAYENKTDLCEEIRKAALQYKESIK